MSAPLLFSNFLRPYSAARISFWPYIYLCSNLFNTWRTTVSEDDVSKSALPQPSSITNLAIFTYYSFERLWTRLISKLLMRFWRLIASFDWLISTSTKFLLFLALLRSFSPCNSTVYLNTSKLSMNCLVGHSASSSWKPKAFTIYLISSNATCLPTRGCFTIFSISWSLDPFLLATCYSKRPAL
jgi:hypothetical protein